jgi:hypothetical protein
VKIKPLHVVAAAFGGVILWSRSGGSGSQGVSLTGSEDIQLHALPKSLPTEFVHWSPVSWAGRCHGYPGAVGAGLTHLIYKGAPDYADQDG